MKKRNNYLMRCFAAVLSIVLMISVCACGMPSEPADTSAHKDLSVATTEISIFETESPKPDVVGVWLCKENSDTILVLNEDFELYWVTVGGYVGDYYTNHALSFMLEGTYSFADDRIIVDGSDCSGNPYQTEIEYNSSDDVITLDGYEHARWDTGYSGQKSIIGDWHLLNSHLDYFSIDLNYYSDVHIVGEKVSFYLDGSFGAFYGNGKMKNEHCYGTYEWVFNGSAVNVYAEGASGLIYVKQLGCGVMALISGQDDGSSYLFYKLV